MFDVEIYEDQNGKSEIKEYLENLHAQKTKDDIIKFSKITTYIDMLKIHGLALREPYIKYICDKIWELRPMKDRILFVSWNNNKFILLSVFTKQTQKTPIKEIKKAKRLLEDYKQRSEKNGL